MTISGFPAASAPTAPRYHRSGPEDPHVPLQQGALGGLVKHLDSTGTGGSEGFQWEKAMGGWYDRLTHMVNGESMDDGNLYLAIKNGDFLRQC